MNYKKYIKRTIVKVTNTLEIECPNRSATAVEEALEEDGFEILRSSRMSNGKTTFIEAENTDDGEEI
jgi:hypothetical protein